MLRSIFYQIITTFMFYLLLQLSVLMPIWIETSRPYIDIIDDWITNGRLVDVRDEFIIQRSVLVLFLCFLFKKKLQMCKECQQVKWLIRQAYSKKQWTEVCW